MFRFFFFFTHFFCFYLCFFLIVLVILFFVFLFFCFSSSVVPPFYFSCFSFLLLFPLLLLGLLLLLSSLFRAVYVSLFDGLVSISHYFFLIGVIQQISGFTTDLPSRRYATRMLNRGIEKAPLTLVIQGPEPKHIGFKHKDQTCH